MRVRNGRKVVYEAREPLAQQESRIEDVRYQPEVVCPRCGTHFSLCFHAGQMGQATCCGLLFRTVIARVDLVVRVLGGP